MVGNALGKYQKDPRTNTWHSMVIINLVLWSFSLYALYNWKKKKKHPGQNIESHLKGKKPCWTGSPLWNSRTLWHQQWWPLSFPSLTLQSQLLLQAHSSTMSVEQLKSADLHGPWGDRLALVNILIFLFRRWPIIVLLFCYEVDNDV